MIDFRLPQNRMELLKRYSVWQLRRDDVDTSVPLTNYIFDRNEFNVEQRYLFAWFYMNTYNTASALVYFNEFPDFHLIDIDRLTKFNDEKVKNIPYESDVKWNKYHIVKMFESYKSLVEEHGTQDAFFKSLCTGTPEENYWSVRDVLIDKQYKCGRYCSWFYMQSLKENCGLDIEAPTMHFGHDCESPTDGLLYALGREDESTRMYIDNGTKKVKTGSTWNKDTLSYLEDVATKLVDEINNEYSDIKLDRFLLETILCSYKKLFRRRQGRYLGYYIDRMIKNINDCESTWTGIDYNIVRDWLSETHPDYELYTSNGVNNSRMHIFLDTGNLPELDMYEDLSNN